MCLRLFPYTYAINKILAINQVWHKNNFRTIKYQQNLNEVQNISIMNLTIKT